MADIFFSYTKADRKRVQPLIAALRERNWTVWWDTNIQGGDSWSDVIEAELIEARCVVVAWSQLSAKSVWVKEEARAASRAQKLVPVTLDSMEPPFGFGGIQAVDLSDWKQDKDSSEFLSLCSAIQGKLGQSTQTSSSSQLPPERLRSDEVASSNTPFLKKKIGWKDISIGAMVLAAIVGVMVLFQALQHDKTASDEKETSIANSSFVVSVQRALCLIPDGIAGTSTSYAIRDYLIGMGRQVPWPIDPASPDLKPFLQSAIDTVGDCARAGFKNAFEVGYLGGDPAKTKWFQNALRLAIEKKGQRSDYITLSGVLDAPTRRAIETFRKLSGGTPGDTIDTELLRSLN